MFEVDKTTGNIRLVQGDSGELNAEGIPTDKNYEMYFSIRDENRVPIGFEIKTQSNYQPVVIFPILASLTDFLTVPQGEETATYYYYVKRCFKETGLEDTMKIGNQPIGSNTITVIPKGAEGTNE